MQLTADQMVQLTISGQDKYGNAVDISGDVVWTTSDASIVEVRYNKSATPTQATAVAVGPVGTASVTVTNDVNHDGSGDFIGSIAIDVVAGQMAEIEVSAGQPQNKPDSGGGGGGGEELPPDTGEEQPGGGWSGLVPRPGHPDTGIPRPEPQRGQQGR